MSAKLAAARGFSFEANRVIDPVLVKGLNLPENAHLVLTVLRPNKIAAESTSKGEVRHSMPTDRTCRWLM